MKLNLQTRLGLWKTGSVRLKLLVLECGGQGGMLVGMISRSTLWGLRVRTHDQDPHVRSSSCDRWRTGPPSSQQNRTEPSAALRSAQMFSSARRLRWRSLRLSLLLSLLASFSPRMKHFESSMFTLTECEGELADRLNHCRKTWSSVKYKTNRKWLEYFQVILVHSSQHSCDSSISTSSHIVNLKQHVDVSHRIRQTQWPRQRPRSDKYILMFSYHQIKYLMVRKHWWWVIHLTKRPPVWHNNDLVRFREKEVCSPWDTNPSPAGEGLSRCGEAGGASQCIHRIISTS